MPPRRLELPLCLAVAVWVIGVAFVWFELTRHEFAEAATVDAAALGRWPDDVEIALSEDRPTLVFCVHPRCPCTFASVREMSQVLGSPNLDDDDRPDLYVVLAVPSEAENAWRETAVVEAATRLPNARLVVDSEGRTTKRFGATTSGTALLFDPSGEVLFAGGVTGSRGHEGANTGATTLERLLTGAAGEAADGTPVFGCRLCSPTRCGPYCTYDPNALPVREPRRKR